MAVKRVLFVLLVLLPLLSSLGPVSQPSSSSGDDESTIVDLGNGQTIEVGPDEVLTKYVLSSAPSEVTGTASALLASEYGTRTDTFSDRTMVYYPSGTLTTADLSVPLGDGWEGYQVDASITDITENRTWLNNYNFATESTWKFGTSYVEGYFSGNNRIQYFNSGGTYTGQWGSRGTGTSQFIDPWGIAFDSSNNLYVADTVNNRIQVFSSTGTFVRQWGSYGTGNGQFNRPTGVALDGSNYVYVVDSGNDRIQVFSSAGAYQRQWGSSGTANGQFHSPIGIAYSSFNTFVYVTDMGNDRVQYFSTAGARQGGWTGLTMPTGIAVRPSNGYVFVADTTANRVVRYTPTGGSATAITASLSSPTGVAVSPDSTYLYVDNSGAHTVRRYSASNNAYQTQWGSSGSGNGQFRFNNGIAVNSAGNVYTSESGGIGRMDANWLSTGHGTGNPSSIFQIDGYYHDAGSGLYGYWYNPGDKAFVRQDLTLDRGDVTWAGISMDYYADCRGWGTYMTGFFELFVSIGDVDSGGHNLWTRQFDAIADDNVWYSTGLVPVDPTYITTPTVSVLAGLRVTQSEWYRTADIRPEGRLDNIILYVKAKATPTSINLQMNGVDVDDVYEGPNPVYGLGTVSYVAADPWSEGLAFANFSWTPSPNPPVPNLEISVEIDAAVTVHARHLDIMTISNIETFASGDVYVAQNATTIRWETNHYVAVPGGYGSEFFFDVSIPSNRDVDYVAQPNYRFVNLSSGWDLGNPGDAALNVSVYQVTLTGQSGFWYIKGSSPNMITDLRVYDPGTSSWVRNNVFRADETTRFRAYLPTTYATNAVTFAVYDSAGTLWTTLQATVDGSGYATTANVNLDAYTAAVGSWEVQALVNDTVTGAGTIRNVGFFRRGFTIQHSTEVAVKYPYGGAWSADVVFGELVLLQFRVNDSDNGALLAGGTMTYAWAAGSGPVSDLGTGEYSVTLDTDLLSSNGAYQVSLSWSKSYYDTLPRTFTINVFYTSELFSPDAPGVSVPRSHDADLELVFEDQRGQPVTGATIVCNWTLDSYQVTPVSGNPGHYILSAQTDAVDLGTYAVSITASRAFIESRTIILSIQVRELHTSAIPSTSLLSLPVGYTTSFAVTYTDTDLGAPISDAEEAISLNWTGSHGSYVVTETATAGVYRVDLYSLETDVLGMYVVRVDVQAYGAQNHTFYLDVVLRTHLTSFYLVNPISPTPYTGSIQIVVVYLDVDANAGIENGSSAGYNVLIYLEAAGLPSLTYTVENGSVAGEYIIFVPASQWGSIGPKSLSIYANWTGPTVKFYNRAISTGAQITGAPTDIYVGESPLATPYGENVTFTIVYFDVGAGTGIVNGTGVYQGNVHIIITVLTPGHSLNQSVMIITEIDFITRTGEYRIEFSSSFLSGISSCQLRIQANWTKSQLPLYENQTIVVTVYTTMRDTTVDLTPLPIVPYDELVNLTIVFRDVLSGQPIIPQTGKLSVSIQESVPYTVIALSTGGGFIYIELDSSSWIPGTHTFHVNVVWYGEPYYGNRTGLAVQITVRERDTSLTHGSYAPTQFGENVTIEFSYRDMDDYTTTGMNGGSLSLDSWLVPNADYWVIDNGDGTYQLILNTQPFASLGVFVVNCTISYGGSRYCMDAADFFYLTITLRRAQLTSEQPDLAPYLAQAAINVTYIDDITSQGIAGATVSASCATANQSLVFGVNYFVDYLGSGIYRIRVETTALGSFGSYTVDVTASRSGEPFYQTRLTSVDVEVSRRPTTISVTRSPLNTPYLDNLTFQIAALDQLASSYISLTKSALIIAHGSGTVLSQSEYSIAGSPSGYTISVNSVLLTASLADAYSITIRLVWGDVAPYYANATTATQVTIIGRYTQASVLSTPAADYFFNLTATLSYSDYVLGSPIDGASVSFFCVNDSSISSWVINTGNGRYNLIVDTTTLGGLGRYQFLANISWSGSPFYQNKTGVMFYVTVNAVSTELKLILTPGTTYYLGDVIEANITFTAISTGTGIEGALVTTDWNTLYGTGASIVELGGGVYVLSIDTAGFNATDYPFTIFAGKLLHLNRTVAAEVMIAARPVDIQVTILPTTPLWTDVLFITVNITDIRGGGPITGASVNVTLQATVFETQDLGGGLYNCSVDTAGLSAGDFVLTIDFAKFNYETREAEMLVRIGKLAAGLDGAISVETAVNGQTVNLEADYFVLVGGATISSGTVVYSWPGGVGYLTWNSGLSLYTAQILVDNVSVGSHSILLQASSANYRTAVTLLTIEIKEINTELIPLDGIAVLVSVWGDSTNVSVYLNNTDLNAPVLGAELTFSIGNVTGIMNETGSGWYSYPIPTYYLEIRDHILVLTSTRNGYVSSSIELTLSVRRVPTKVNFIGGALVEAYYGTNATFQVQFWDTHNAVGISDATTTYAIEGTEGVLVYVGNGIYLLQVNTRIAAAGPIPRDVSVTLLKDHYNTAYASLKLLIKRIPTEIVGVGAVDFPVGDDYTQFFVFNDTLNAGLIANATATAIWEFGSTPLYYMGNGVYRFGPEDTGKPRLEVRDIPYSIHIVMSKTNFSRGEFELALMIRLIDTELIVANPPVTVYAGQQFVLVVTYWDNDHDMAIRGGFNDTVGTSLTRVPGLDQDFGNGTYVFGFTGPFVQAYNLRVTLGKADHANAEYSFVVFTSLPPEQQALTTLFGWSALTFIGIVALGAYYVRVLSVPKMLRRIRKMISSLEKGVVPTAPAVRRRRSMILEIVNEGLGQIGIRKVEEDIGISSVDVTALDVESMLQELAAVTGLTEADISVLREDLEKMRPSERAGFIGEVIKQERARRARDLAEAGKPAEAKAAVRRKPTEEELAVFKEKLLAMGIEETEADLMVEQARELTKAEIDALLEQIGGSKD